MKVRIRRFFSKQRLSRGKSYLKSAIWPLAVLILFPSVCGSCTLVTGTTVVIFVYDQHGEYLANP